MKHTQGPWKVHHHSHINKEQWLSILNGAFDITHNGASNPAVVACSRYSAMSNEENLANAQRIVDCVNACEGINPKAVSGLLAALKEVGKALSIQPNDTGRLSIYNVGVRGDCTPAAKQMQEDLVTIIAMAIAKAEERRE